MSGVAFDAYCQRCKENFPATDQQGFSMGRLTPIAHIAIPMRQRLGIQESEDPAGRYFCGNCYYDVTDD